MIDRYTRSDFLKQSLTVCTGMALGGINLSCCAKAIKGRALTEDARGTAALEEFDALGYCCYNCEEQCKTYAATKSNDLEVKAEIAKRWSEQSNRQISPEEVSCYGCRIETPPLGFGYKESCPVRMCAKEKQVTTCAHCNDFAECNKELWNEWPKLRDQAESIRKTLTG
jgi:hypothetical protein